MTTIPQDLTRAEAIAFLANRDVDTRERLRGKDTETLRRWAKFWNDHAIREAA